MTKLFNKRKNLEKIGNRQNFCLLFGKKTKVFSKNPPVLNTLLLVSAHFELTFAGLLCLAVTITTY
jgi:hypothetical protein